ncbi:methyl-accepting chemotaxis protein [Clostridium sp. HCP1S3_B4]|uniref:methyl-accepting chemotaxis protein n=1 Tax=unclassified Clostridium TaxID=2614128 RepID=UPI003F89F7C5
MVKVKRSMKTDLVVVTNIIIFIIVMILSAVTDLTLRKNLDNEVKEGLEGVAYSVLDVLEKGTEGDIVKDSAGNLKKGNFAIGIDNEFVDSIKEHTNIDVTIFAGDTRVASSVKDSKGDRVVGTKASHEIIEEVINKGNTYFSKKLDIEGTNYYVYYVPIKDKSGEVIGVSVAGKPTGKVDSIAYSGIIRQAIFGFLAIIIAAGVIYIRSNSIAKSINGVCEYLMILSKGDLSKSIDKKYIDRKDEIGLIAKVSEELKDSLKSLIGKTIDASKSLIDHSSQLEVISDDCLRNTESVNRAMNEISNGAMSQAENTQNASEKSINMGDLIKNIKDNVDNLDSSTGAISKAESDADKIIEESSEYNNVTIDSVTKIAQQTEKTNEAVNKIKNAIELITEIADQTNLLALNASIEAARAGEAGKGFAVVAEEIQKLADESNKSAKTIEQSIQELAVESDRTVSIMKNVEEAVNNQKVKITQTKDTFKVVSNGVIKSVEDIHEISNQAEGLDKVKDGIIDILQNLSAIAEENAASTEETTASMNELASTIEKVSKSSEKLKDLAEDLEKSVSIFKI